MVSRLFQRLAAAYGKQWLDVWDGVPLPQVKAVWADALEQFGPEEIGQALDHLPKFPPNLPEFVDLCRQFRRREQRALAIVDGRRDSPQGGFQSLRSILQKSAKRES